MLSAILLSLFASLSISKHAVEASSTSLAARQDGAQDPDLCNPECELMCTKFKRHTMRIDGTANYQLTSSITLAVQYGDEDVCPMERHEYGMGSCGFRYACKEGWGFFLPSQAMEGSWNFDLQGLPYERYIPDGWPQIEPVSMDDIECDAWQCGDG